MALKDFLNTGSTSPVSDDDEGWININNTTWSPEHPGDTIEGELVEKKFNIGKWNHNLYVIKRNDDVAVMYGAVTGWIRRWMKYKLVILSAYVIRVRLPRVMENSCMIMMY